MPSYVHLGRCQPLIFCHTHKLVLLPANPHELGLLARSERGGERAVGLFAAGSRFRRSPRDREREREKAVHGNEEEC